MTATPSITPSVTLSATPSVTPSTSPPPAGNIVVLAYGANKAAACSEFAPTDYFCLVGSTDLCTATGLLSSDGISCFGNASATAVSDGVGAGSNNRLWNGTSFGSCSTCPF